MLETPQHQRLGEEGEACFACAAPLAADQRYCLNCGERRAEARIPFMDVLGARPVESRRTVERETAPPAHGRFGDVPTPVAIGIGVGMVVLLLSFGTVLGTLLAGGNNGVPLAAAGPGGPGTAAQVVANRPGAFRSDWPEGKEGYTVQLQALRKDGTNPQGVADAKKAAADKKAPAVGALDSDDHKSLDPGNFVIFSGVFDSRKKAQAGLKEVEGAFPEAKVVRVAGKGGGGAEEGGDDELKAEGAEKISDEELTAGKESAVVSRDQLDNIERISGNSRQAAKLPKTIGIEGKPPPKDNKAPGAGSTGGTTIK